MGRRNTVILVAGVVLVLLIVGGARQRRDQTGESIGLGFDSSDLEDLGDQLEELSFEDLEGLDIGDLQNQQGDVFLNFTLDDLEGLEDLLSGLEFEDLEGFSEE